MWEGVGDRTELQHIDPHSIGHNRVSFPFSWAAQPGAWGPASLGAAFLYCILSPTRLIPNNQGSWGPILLGAVFSTASFLQLSGPQNWLNFLCTELYNSSTPTFFLWASQIALIQPIHGQSYTLLFLDRMHLLFTLVHFLFWQAGQVVGQYATIYKLLFSS